MNKNVAYTLLTISALALLYFVWNTSVQRKEIQTQLSDIQELEQNLVQLNLMHQQVIATYDSSMETTRFEFEESLQSQSIKLQDANRAQVQMLSEKRELEALEQQLRDSLGRIFLAKEELESALEQTRSNFQDSISSLQIEVEQLESLVQSKKVLRFKSPSGTDITYLGETKDDKAHGTGVGVYANGNLYEGEWQMGFKHGLGIYQWYDGEHFEGNFDNDRRNGFGIYTWKNGEVFHGYWKDDRRHGEGIIYDKSGGVKREGVWDMDKFVDQQNVHIDSDMIDSVSIKKR